MLDPEASLGESGNFHLHCSTFLWIFTSFKASRWNWHCSSIKYWICGSLGYFCGKTQNARGTRECSRIQDDERCPLVPIPDITDVYCTVLSTAHW